MSASRRQSGPEAVADPCETEHPEQGCADVGCTHNCEEWERKHTQPPVSTDYDQIGYHIRHKATMLELDPTLADRMLEMLVDAEVEGADVAYEDLHLRAAWPPLPATAYHTAPASARASIRRSGLRPGDGTQNWGHVHGAHAMGVYVGPEPDLIGKWAFAFDVWDIWRVNTAGLTWQPDRMNPGCWYLPEPVGPERLTYLETRSSRSHVRVPLPRRSGQEGES